MFEEMTSAYLYFLGDGLNLTPGEKVVIRVLNSDGTEKSILCDLMVPRDKKLTGRAVYSGNLVDIGG